MLVLAFVLGVSAAALPGWWMARRARCRHAAIAAVVTRDLAALDPALSVLREQVRTSVATSEAAVLATVERMNRVYARTLELHERVTRAVERSRAWTADALDGPGLEGRAADSLAEHQRGVEAARRESQEHMRALTVRVRGMMPLVESISEVSRQTGLLSINASIEAAHAGEEGAGFKAVATEVRRLSAQTAEAARSITQNIAQISEATHALDAKVASEQALDARGEMRRLAEVADRIRQVGTGFSEAVAYLAALSSEMEAGMGQVSVDIMDALGAMQFQDINRQQLEQVDAALEGLTRHFTHVAALVSGRDNTPPGSLAVQVEGWKERYVMHAQHVAHAGARGESVASGSLTPAAAPGPAGKPFAAPKDEAPRIELF